MDYPFNFNYLLAFDRLLTKLAQNFSFYFAYDITYHCVTINTYKNGIQAII